MVKEYIQLKISMYYAWIYIVVAALGIAVLTFVIWKLYKGMMDFRERQLQKMIEKWETEKTAETKDRDCDK